MVSSFGVRASGGVVRKVSRFEKVDLRVDTLRFFFIIVGLNGALPLTGFFRSRSLTNESK